MVGREMFTNLPGEAVGEGIPWPGWVSAESMLVQVGRWLRRDAVEPLGFHDFDGRSRRLRMLLDAYGYGADRVAFGAVVVRRARRQAAAIRRMAAAGDAAAAGVLFVARYFEAAAVEVEALPATFWAS